MESDLKKLLLVYNADAGLGNKLLDGLHKAVSPKTYNCQLCFLTYGLITEKRRWKEFRKTFHLPMLFLYKDQFVKYYGSKFGHKFEYPVILAETSTGIELVVSKSTLENMEGLEDLIQYLEAIA